MESNLKAAESKEVPLPLKIKILQATRTPDKVIADATKKKESNKKAANIAGKKEAKLLKSEAKIAANIAAAEEKKAAKLAISEAKIAANIAAAEEKKAAKLAKSAKSPADIAEIKLNLIFSEVSYAARKRN